VKGLIDWLAASRASVALQDVLWIVPAVQTVHLIAVAIVLSSMLMVGLRILGLAAMFQTVEQTADRYLSWVWPSLVILLFTGAVLILAEPGRTLPNASFWVKMVLLATVLMAAIALRAATRFDPRYWETPRWRSGGTRALVALNFALWCGVAVAGRWIAYTKT
jgi:predicted tellurium resistance membrane protein TerC